MPTKENPDFRLETEEGSHEFETEFTYDKVLYYIEGTIHNTYGKCEKCDHGFDMPSSSDDNTEIELLSALFGGDFEHTLEDIVILKAIETELYKHI